MKQYKIGILGATGAVGQEMQKILRERNFPVGELRLLASKNSAGKVINGVTVMEACAENFKGLDIILGAAENDIAEKFIDDIRASGAVFVDNSSAFRLCPEVPLVVPEINPEDVKKHSGVISNPNCTTVISCTAVNALNKFSPIESMVVSTYQAVSGAGAAGPKELFAEVEALRNGEGYEPKVFAKQIAYNEHIKKYPNVPFNAEKYDTENFRDCPFAKRGILDIKNLRTHISPDDIWEKYVPMGFEQFKIEGRTASPVNVLETYVYYMAKPECRDEARFTMYKSLENSGAMIFR